MSIPNPVSWLKTRPHYVRYIDAKKAHKQALKEFNASRYAVIHVAKQYLKSTMTSTIEILVDAIVENLFVEDSNEMSDKLKINIKHIEDLPIRFIKARQRYAKAIKELNESHAAVEKAEIAYDDAVFEALHSDYQFSIKDVADVFGTWVASQRNRMNPYKNKEIEDADEPDDDVEK